MRFRFLEQGTHIKGIEVYANLDLLLNPMIVPLVSESEWLSELEGLSAWQPPSGSVVVLVPHPDDETLGAGGLISKLRSCAQHVLVVAVTDGENAYTNAMDLARIRQSEQERALACLGISTDCILRLRLPDSDLVSHETQMIAEVLRFVTADTHILAPWLHDFHPDHEACGRVAKALSQQTGASLSYYFFWTWHRGVLSTIANCNLQCFELDEETRWAKLKALECHASQLHHESGNPILPEELLAPAKRHFEVFLSA